MILLKSHVLTFLSQNILMAVATQGEHPWIASVYYSFDDDLNLYFLSDPATLHCKQIAQNSRVSVAIADSHQLPAVLKRGLQLWGEARQISDTRKVSHALSLWKKTLNVKNKELTYANMAKHVIKGRMYQITPKLIKLFDQELFKVEDGKEPTLSL